MIRKYAYWFILLLFWTGCINYKGNKNEVHTKKYEMRIDSIIRIITHDKKFYESHPPTLCLFVNYDQSGIHFLATKDTVRINGKQFSEIENRLSKLKFTSNRSPDRLVLFDLIYEGEKDENKNVEIFDIPSDLHELFSLFDNNLPKEQCIKVLKFISEHIDVDLPDLDELLKLRTTNEK